MFKKIVFCLMITFLMLTGISFAVDKAVEFTWTKTPEADLAEFVIYMGNAPMTDKTDAVQTFTIPYVLGQSDYVHEESITCADGTTCTFYFRCAAKDTSGNEEGWSAEEPNVVIDSEAPGVPTNFTATIKIVTP